MTKREEMKNMTKLADQKNWARKLRIDEIRKVIADIRADGGEIAKRKQFVLQISAKYNVTIRKAAEYLDVAEAPLI